MRSFLGIFLKISFVFKTTIYNFHKSTTGNSLLSVSQVAAGREMILLNKNPSKVFFKDSARIKNLSFFVFLMKEYDL